ncbi:hypothetical protein PMAYCL1PPCAC_06843, partial [Pristionchus mayeri]
IWIDSCSVIDCEIFREESECVIFFGKESEAEKCTFHGRHLSHGCSARPGVDRTSRPRHEFRVHQ